MAFRQARMEDLPALQVIEVAAGAVFRTVGMDAIADDAPPPIADLLAAQHLGRIWVSVDAQDRPVAYVMAEVLDDTGHVEQVSVHPDHARQGLGRDLIEVVATWARGFGLTALTLTTYAEVPWNAPYYERLGFEVVADDHATEALRTIRDHEAARGLDAWPRVTMRRDLRDDLRATVEQSGEKQGARRQESSDNQDMNLPAGLTTRPLTLADATAVTAVMAAEELADTGTVAIEEADIVADWQRPSFDISTATIGVFDGPRLLGYAEHSGHDRGDTAVDPGVHGRGIGTFLAQWLEDRCRSAGAAVIGMPVPLGSPADRFLAERGYVVRWTSWILVLPPGASIPERPLPEGHVLRDALDEDLRDAWTVLEDAFLEWSERPREPFEDFLASVVDRPGHQPWNLRVLVGPDGEIVGACHIVLADDCGYVNRIAVRKGNRGLGLAQAMLADAFEHSRAHGATRSELSTDSRTGALGLYEKVGMVVSSTWVNRALTL